MHWEPNVSDGTYCEHGREIFDEEADTEVKEKGKSKKPVSISPSPSPVMCPSTLTSPLIPPQILSVSLSHPPPPSPLTPPPNCWSPVFHSPSHTGPSTQPPISPYSSFLPSFFLCNACYLLQGVPKRVAKPTSNIKHLLLSKAGSSGKKKKQVQQTTTCTHRTSI